MFNGKATGILFESLCEKADSLIEKAFIFSGKKPEEVLEPRKDLLHTHVGWELKIYLTPGMETDTGICESPTIGLFPPFVQHTTSDIKNMPDLIILGIDSHSFTIIHHGEFAVFTGKTSINSQKRLDFANRIMEDMNASLSKDNPMSKHFAKGLLICLFSISRELLEEEERNAKRGRIVGKAIDFIEHYFYDPKLSVTAVAKYVNVTPNHLAFLFKKENLPPVRRQIIVVRLKRAEKLLEGNMTVKEVASITGWDNQFYFSNSYFKEFGRRPSNKSQVLLQNHSVLK